MNTVTLKRQSFDVSRSSQEMPDSRREDCRREDCRREDFRKELALKATSLLKYTKMREDLLSDQDANVFLQALREKDILPFTQESVEEYKQAAIQKVDKHKLSKFLYHNTVFLFVGIALIGIFIMLMSWTWSTHIAQLSTLITLGCLPILGLAVWVMSKLDPTTPPPEYAWEYDNLASYKLPIPEFVLETAVFIKTKFPSAEFSICTLREKRRESFALDPFLVCRYAGREYHLEVWNEPGYKQVREV